MTTTVTIKHDSPNAKDDIVVRPCNIVNGNTEYAGIEYDKLVKPGESVQMQVESDQILSVDVQVND